MKFLIILFSFVLITLINAQGNRDWDDFKRRFRRSFRNRTEESSCMNRFRRKDEQIKRHNLKFAKHKEFYTMGHNRFSDMSLEELSRIMPNIQPGITTRSLASIPSVPNVPDSLSYKEFCQPVQDQKDCGCCWAFAVGAQLETQIKIKFPVWDTIVSAQYLLDCSVNSGCAGGWPANTFDFLYRRGFVSADRYPYVARKQTCRNPANRDNPIIAPPTTFFVNGDEQALMNAFVTNGPIVVLFQVDLPSFMSYKSGIYWEPNGKSDCRAYNHGMLLVGYGTDYYTFDDPVDYWLVKNSFGTHWGEEGYVKMIRNYPGLENNCNIACYGFYALV